MYDNPSKACLAEKDKAVLGPEETPGPGNMCFHWKEPRVLCVLKPGHDGEHWYSKFTVTINTEEK